MKAWKPLVSSQFGEQPAKGFKLSVVRGWYMPSDEEIARDEERKRQEIENAERVRRSDICSIRHGARLPARLSVKTEELLPTTEGTEWRNKLDSILESLGTGGKLYSLVGSYGVGKSQLGVGLCWLAAEKLIDSRFIHATELFDTIKDVYRSDDGDTIQQILSVYAKPKLLVIDEVNNGLSEHDIRYLHRVVCGRFDAMKDTLLISNEKKADFQKLVGDRVVSRMIEAGGIIEANWPSFRSASK